MLDVYSPYPGAFSLAHVVDSCLFPSDSVCQECLNFVAVAIQQVSADCHWLLLSSFVSCLGTHVTQTSLKPSLFGMISLTVLWLMYSWWVTLSVVTCQVFRVMKWTHSVISSAEDMDGHLDDASLVVLVWLLLNVMSCSYTLLFSKACLPFFYFYVHTVHID
jgi:hypothetical protein